MKKRQKDTPDIDSKTIGMYAKGPTARQISEQVGETYGFERGEGSISDVTDKILQDMSGWQGRPLDGTCPTLSMDAVHFSAREDHAIRKLAAYVILGITADGKKDVVSLQVGESESAKYWLGGPGRPQKPQGQGRHGHLCRWPDRDQGSDTRRVSGHWMPTSHRPPGQERPPKHVPCKGMEPFAAGLKTIHLAPNEERALANLGHVTEKWNEKHPNAMEGWEKNWDATSPIFKFPSDVRQVVHTTNAIGSLNGTYKELNRQRPVFPSEAALLEALCLATPQATKKWSQPPRDWAKAHGESSIMYEGRMPD